MTGLSRRKFIGGAAAGMVAVTAAGVPGMAGAAPLAAADADDALDDDAQLTELVVARVRNTGTGEITLYVGNEEISYTDRTLARRLARAAAR